MLRYIGPLVILVCVLALAADAASARTMPTPTTTTCYEDETCWHWPTMGNRKRGVVDVNGNPMVVGACKFGRMFDSGQLRYRLGGHVILDRLHGDGWARALSRTRKCSQHLNRADG